MAKPALKTWAEGRVHPATAAKQERERVAKGVAQGVQSGILDGKAEDSWSDLKAADMKLDRAVGAEGVKARREKDIAIRDLESVVASMKKWGIPTADWERKLAGMR